ncbi:MAG TPA: (4Fe-4S)-binding protein [Bacteroidales bacterium]|nr:(4Fe-4S)-binding protein [Bacteroidales bacterium]
MEKNNRDYTNGEITVHWQPEKCIHSTICYTKLRSVFDPAKRPWVNMQGAETDKIIDIVNQCPTDALTFSWNKDSDELTQSKDLKGEDNNHATRIQIIHNGPAIISGDFQLTDILGSKLANANTVALCRCGHSSTQPFCDGTHNTIHFKEKR